MQTITTGTTDQARRVADYEPGEEAIESTYTMIGFDAETRMWTYSGVFEDIDAAHDYAERKQLGPWKIYASNPAAYAAGLGLLCYLRKPNWATVRRGERQYYIVDLFEWTYRAHAFARTYPLKGSPLYREIYGEDAA
jgi:hypothetical protein